MKETKDLKDLKDLMTEYQLPLELHLRDDCTFESFYPGKNTHIISIIKKFILQSGDGFIYLWGRTGVGCSHLLQASCHFATLHQLSSVYLCLQPRLNLSIFTDLERTDLICLDGLETIAGNETWEEALFDLYNRVKSNGKKMMIASKQPVKGAGIQLQDLQSRLEWGIAMQVQPLEDDALIGALQLRAQQRGMEIHNDVAEFIIHRVARSMGQLYAILEILDEASLRLKRKITIPFVKKILSL